MEKSQHIWKETYIYRKRPTCVERDTHRETQFVTNVSKARPFPFVTKL